MMDNFNVATNSRRLVLLIFVVIIYPITCSLSLDHHDQRETFSEELLLKRLPSKHFLANFRFTTRTKSSVLGDHYDLFPKLIGELIQIYNLAELHLSLSRGFWRHNSWGFQPQPPAPIGAQVWAWFQSNTTDLDPLFKWVKPSEDRQRPYLLEMGLEIPGKTECFVEIEFQKLLLRWTEYPPDAHHGLAVPAAIVSFYSANYNNLTVPLGRRALISESLRDSSRSPWLVQIFGEILLVNLPTPDFSMPYNVICLVCTVMALAFGPLHNMTCKSLVLKSPAEIKKNSVKAKVRAVVEKVMRLLLRRKKEERKQNTAENEKIASENADISERQQTGPVGSPVEED